MTAGIWQRCPFGSARRGSDFEGFRSGCLEWPPHEVYPVTRDLLDVRYLNRSIRVVTVSVNVFQIQAVLRVYLVNSSISATDPVLWLIFER